MRKISIYLIVLSTLFVAGCSVGEEFVREKPMQVSVTVQDRKAVKAEGQDYAFEDMVREVSMGVYEDGRLIFTEHHTDLNFVMNIPDGKEYSIYFIGNAGNLTLYFPEDERNVESIRFEIPSFARMRNTGVPMAAKVVSGWKSSLPVRLKRLVSRMEISVDDSGMGLGGDENSFESRLFEVHQAAKALYPFAEGGSRAGGPEDLFEDVFDMQEAADVSGSGVLYIPENRQRNGPVEGDRAAGTGHSLCTYISFKGTKTGTLDGVGGEIQYRFFPGNGREGNFEIERNCTYNISLVLTWDGMFIEDCWKIEKSGWCDNRSISVSLKPDSGYSSDIGSLRLAKGSTDIPIYIRYLPNGEVSENQEGGFPPGFGWMFSPSGSTDALEYDEAYADAVLGVGYGGSRNGWSKHLISISEEAETGLCTEIVYHTFDRRKTACLGISVEEPEIYLSQSVVECSFNEYGESYVKEIRILESSTVNPLNITISVSGDISIKEYDTDSGTAQIFWNSINTGETRKTATVIFEGLGIREVCTLYQYGLFSTDNPEQGGNGDIDY